ncbi:MAG: hypothetical protein WBF11_03395 [Methyloceanibacter sp.]
MPASTFIARILGPLFVIMGLGLLLEGESFRVIATEFLRSPALIYLSGIITLVAGLAILNVHHVWVRDWPVIITIFGWLALIGGIFRLLAPSLVQRVGEAVIAHPHWPAMGGAATLVLGAFFTVMGYQDVWAGPKQKPVPRTATVKAAGSAAKGTKRPRRKPGSATPPAS